MCLLEVPPDLISFIKCDVNVEVPLHLWVLCDHVVELFGQVAIHHISIISPLRHGTTQKLQTANRSQVAAWEANNCKGKPIEKTNQETKPQTKPKRFAAEGASRPLANAQAPQMYKAASSSQQPWLDYEEANATLVWPNLQDHNAAKLGKACLLINVRAMLWICLHAFQIPETQ